MPIRSFGSTLCTASGARGRTLPQLEPGRRHPKAEDRPNAPQRGLLKRLRATAASVPRLLTQRRGVLFPAAALLCGVPLNLFPRLEQRVCAPRASHPGKTWPSCEGGAAACGGYILAPSAPQAPPGGRRQLAGWPRQRCPTSTLQQAARRRQSANGGFTDNFPLWPGRTARGFSLQTAT